MDILDITEPDFRISIARYDGSGRRVTHAVVTPLINEDTPYISVGLEKIIDRLKEIERQAGRDMAPAYVRYHICDPVNDSDTIGCRCVGQPPLARARESILVVLAGKSDVRHSDRFSSVVVRGQYTDYRFSSVSPESMALDTATRRALLDCDAWLRSHGSSLAGDCLRTWFWIRDIDATYQQLVRARNEVFGAIGLTSRTHFIASTGIGATQPTPHTALSFDALATGGLQPEQITYIRIPDSMNQAIDYGVAFERATAVDYGDRRVVYVSGTASIDNSGKIVGPGDISVQTIRMCDNVDALLSAAGVEGSDLLHIILYVRNTVDGPFAEAIVRKRFPGIPCLAVQAQVCRPGWLVEMECVAMRESSAPYAPY